MGDGYWDFQYARDRRAENTAPTYPLARVRGCCNATISLACAPTKRGKKTGEIFRPFRSRETTVLQCQGKHGEGGFRRETSKSVIGQPVRWHGVQSFSKQYAANTGNNTTAFVRGFQMTL